MKNRLSKEIKQKNIFLILIITSIIAVISLGTYALLVWNSKENTEVTVRIGAMAEVKFETGQNVNISNLAPVFDYEKDGEVANFTVNKITYENIDVNVKFNVTTLSDNLKQESFKYALLKSYNNVDFTKVAEGNFKEITNGSVIDFGTETQDMTKVNYKFIIYIDGNMENPVTMQEGNLGGYISVEANVVKVSPSLATLTNLNLTSLLNEGEPDFTLPATTDEGIYAMEDDLGTSYYFRGASERNYVKFAGYYWRIIRINGDGTIRMIYDGTTAHKNGTVTTDKHLTNIEFNTLLGIGAMGYMYGSNGALNGNFTDSTIKSYLDNTWYANTILNTEYEEYVKDAIYCNERVDLDGSYTYLSTQMSRIYQRIESFNIPVSLLTCIEPNDRVTLNNSEIVPTDGKGTNKALKYPIGLITADEVIMGGTTNNNNPNTSYYLYSGNESWTMSPRAHYGGMIESHIYTFAGNGLSFLITSSIMVTNQAAVRPVISISVDALKYGDGSSGNPFRLTSEI